MSTRQGNLKDYQGNKIAPNTCSAAVLDEARSQGLSASLTALVEKNALGYPAFSTVSAYSAGDKVFYDRRLYKFIAPKAAGDWDATKVAEFSLKEYCDALEEGKLSVDGYSAFARVGLADNIAGDVEVTEQTALGVTAIDTQGDIIETGNGPAEEQKIYGDGVSWNQLYDVKAGGDSVASESAQLEFLYGKVAERYTTVAATVQMKCLFVREWLSGVDLTERTPLTGEGYWPALVTNSEDANYNADDYTGMHYFVRATHDEVIERSGSEGAYSYSSPFFVSGSSKRQVHDMAVIFGIRGGGISANPYTLPSSAPSTLPTMLGWLMAKVGLKDEYAYNAGQLIGVTKQRLVSRGANLLDPGTGTTGVALLPYYENNVDAAANGAYKLAAAEGATITGVALTSMARGITLDNPEPNASGVYEIVVEPGDAVVLQVSGTGLSNAFCWEVWDDTTTIADAEPYSEGKLNLDIARVYGKLNGAGAYVQPWSDGVMPAGLNPNTGTTADILNIANNTAVINIFKTKVSDFTVNKYTSYLGWYRLDKTDAMPQMANTDRGNTPFFANLITFFVTSGVHDKEYKIHSYWQAVGIRDSSKATVESFLAAYGNNPVWYVRETPLVYSDLMYDTRVDTSAGNPVLVPLAQAFPGLVLTNNCGTRMEETNWDTSNLEFKDIDAGTSVSPIVESKYASNAAELLDTISQTGYVTPDDNADQQTALVQALNAFATANSLTGTFSVSDGRVIYTPE